MHAHALDNLRYIRETMERASFFTALPGVGIVLIGLTALEAASLASHYNREVWLAVWLLEAVMASAIGFIGAAIKARRVNIPLLSGPGRKFLLGFAPPLVAGAILTFALFRADETSLLPGVWLLLYGTGVLCGGAASVRIIPVMGACFMLIGALVLAAPPALGNLYLAAGFGGIHILFGIIITVKYGG